MSGKTIDPPNEPERGRCEPQITEKPAKMPREMPSPIKVPEPILAPNWPAPVKEPAKVS